MSEGLGSGKVQIVTHH